MPKFSVQRVKNLPDLRSNIRQQRQRAFMTRAAESGIAAHTLRDLPGHKTASMADRYIRRANIPVVDATEAVSGVMAAMMEGPVRT